MTAQAIVNPLPTFIGITGLPLTGGKVYFGQPDQDPRQFPLSVYYDEDLSIPAPQPLRTIAGYLYRNGGPTNVWANSSYSVLVLDANGRQVFYSPNWTGASAGNVVFLASGTGAVPRDVQTKLRESVSVEDYGARADGVTDCSVFIETAAAALAARGGGVLYFPPGTTGVYKCTKRLDLPYSNITYYGPGVTLDFSSLDDPEVSTYKFIKLVGDTGFGASYNLTANCTERTYTVSLAPADAATFVAGDWVQVLSEATYPYVASTVKKAELKQIQSVSGSTVRFRQALYNSYLTANTAKLRKITFIENVEMSGFTIKGRNTEGGKDVGIEVEYVNRFRVSDNKFKDIDQECVRVYNSIRGDIEDNWFDGVRYAASGLLFYGVVLYNCVQWTNVRSNHGHELRHLVTTSASATRYGEPYFINVSGNVMENAQAGDSFASWAYENHGFGRWVTWSYNQADSCHTGINIERGDNIVIGNIFTNCRFYGILLSDDARDLQNITIADNIIDGTTADPDVPTGQAIAIYLQAQASCVRRNIRIADNTISNWGEINRSSCYGIKIEAGSGAAVGCVVDNNTIDNELAYRAGDFGVRVAQAGWKVTNNTLTGYERAFYLEAADISLRTNEVVLVAAIVSTDRAVELRGNNIVATGNTFRNVYQAFVVVAGATSCKIAGNNQYGTTVTTVTDGGTSTVFNFGAVSGF